MTDATRLTPLGVMVLALLREDPMHPYEMIRLMRQRHDDRIVSITNGTLYHTVARLEKQGLLTEVGVDRDGNRPERTTYALTDAGEAAIIDWVRRELPRLGRTGGRGGGSRSGVRGHVLLSPLGHVQPAGWPNAGQAASLSEIPVTGSGHEMPRRGSE